MKALNNIQIGTWLQDTTGIYEVTEIHASMDRVYLKEVQFTEGDYYTLTNDRVLTTQEVAHMKVC